MSPSQLQLNFNFYQEFGVVDFIFKPKKNATFRVLVPDTFQTVRTNFLKFDAMPSICQTPVFQTPFFGPDFDFFGPG